MAKTSEEHTVAHKHRYKQQAKMLFGLKEVLGGIGFNGMLSPRQGLPLKPQPKQAGIDVPG